MHSLIYELPGVFFSSLMFICIYLSTEKNNSTSKNAAWVFLFLFFFNNDLWKAKKKKDFKNKFRQTSYIKEKNQANQNKQAKQRNKKVMYLNL